MIDGGAFGVDRQPFPLSFTVRETGGSWQVRGAAAQASELVDMLFRSANDTVLVVDLATTSFLHEDYSSWQPSLIAAEQGVDVTVHSVGAWVCHSPEFGAEILQMHRDSLPRFLDDTWSPYELSLLDVPGTPTPAQLDEIALILRTAGAGEAVLPALPGSRVWYSGHDDCYLSVESTDPALPAAILSRLLTRQAASALADTGAVIPVPEPDTAMAERLIRENPHWIGVVGSAVANSVTLHLSAVPQPWRLDHALPDHADYTATLDTVHGTWQLAPVEDAPPG
ncbi:hypothetical protein SRB5_01890 [Streptomyces sp. RB5]|uniref:Uncharacterized protein n=1 Tax=Streptomyces smaragdinus TaxID=2585196 RepID=A0A7K0C9F0_9ACTN|nr:hypothetical protein [Streptomyces smaragdinus]MQY10085.1 hypothetical protein [Streptomyces smaragdinus]